MAKTKPRSVPDVVTTSEAGNFSWLEDIRDSSISELVEKYAYAEAVVETVREPLLILDKNLQVKSANKSFFDTFKMTKQETYGRHIYDLNGGEWKIAELKKLLEEILPENSHFNDFEVTHDFSRLGKRVMLLNARRIELEEKKTQLILLSIEDITQKKTMEMQKDEFISNVSHELKSPLTSMKAYVQLAKKRMANKASEQDNNLLEKINHQTDKLTGLINELLQMSLSESNGDNLKKRSINLDSLIDKVVLDYQEAYPNFTFSREGKLKTKVLCDKNRIEQVLVNLLTNSIKYSPKSSKIVVHSAIKNSEAMVGVQDFGSGILKKDQPYIFERYYRSKAKVDKNVQGFGLGLYISANIINLHNGKIWFKSIKGKGSTFYFSIPVK